MTDAAGSAAAPDATTVQDVGADPTVAAGGEAATVAAGDGSLPFTTLTLTIDPDDQDGGASSPSGTTVAPLVRDEVAAPAEVPDGSRHVKTAVVSSYMHHVQMVLLHFFNFSTSGISIEHIQVK